MAGRTKIFHRGPTRYQFTPGAGGSLIVGDRQAKQPLLSDTMQRRAKVIGPELPEEPRKKYALRAMGGRMVYTR